MLATIAIVVLAFAAVLYAMRLFDHLVQWEYEHAREQWNRDGNPDGFFWRAAECSVLKSDLAKKRLGVLWLFRTPAWAAQSVECRKWLVQHRLISAAVAFAVFVVLSRLLFRLLLH
jgi:hypothetical protein